MIDIAFQIQGSNLTYLRKNYDGKTVPGEKHWTYILKISQVQNYQSVSGRSDFKSKRSPYGNKCFPS